MDGRGKIYLATVCLERNRWGSRAPSFAVSDWLPRIAADGFDGIELWENHFLTADNAEQARLAAGASPVAVYNSYAGFEDGAAEARRKAAEAVRQLGALAVKYNLGGDAARRAEYRRNLLAWAGQLPPACRLLCECHSGTALERPEEAAAFFADLAPGRFGVIAHVCGDPEPVEQWLAALDGRVHHLHVQMRETAPDPAVPAGRAQWDACFEAARAHGFAGSAAIEFTRGIGPDERMETLYANARTALAFCRERLAGRDRC